MIALGYIRVSTPGQAEEGVSLEVQEADLLAWAEREGLKLELYRDEGRSGATLDRPGIQSLLARLSDPDVAVVGVWKLDRLSRDNLDRGLVLRECQRHHVRFVSVTQPEVGGESAEGALVSNVLGAVAQFESQMLGARVRAAQARLAQAGKLITRRPYGYADDWTVVPEHAEVIHLIDRLYLEGRGTLRIAQELNRQGIPSPSGGEWLNGAVWTILNRPTYSGIQRWGRLRRQLGGKRRVTPREEWQHAPLAVPIIRPPERWQRIQAEREKRSGGGRRGPVTGMFTGLLRCGYCDSGMSVYSYRLASGERRVKYRCNAYTSGATCPGGGTNHVSEDNLVTWVRGRVESRWGFPVEVKGDADVAEIERELRHLERRRQRIINGFAAGAIELEELEANTEAYRRRREVLEERLKAEPRRAPSPQAVARIFDMPHRPRDALRAWARDCINYLRWDGSQLEIDWRL